MKNISHEKYSWRKLTTLISQNDSVNLFHKTATIPGHILKGKGGVRYNCKRAKTKFPSNPFYSPISLQKGSIFRKIHQKVVF